MKYCKNLLIGDKMGIIKKNFRRKKNGLIQFRKKETGKIKSTKR